MSFENGNVIRTYTLYSTESKSMLLMAVGRSNNQQSMQCQVVLGTELRCTCRRKYVDARYGQGQSLLSHGRVRLPSTVPLTAAYMSDAGAYLLDSGRIFVLWLGKRVPKEFISQARRMAVAP